MPGTAKNSAVHSFKTLEAEDRLLKEHLGKTISVFYNDTFNSVSFKVGKFLDYDPFNIKILEQDKENLTIIPRNKCIRIELGGETVAKASTR